MTRDKANSVGVAMVMSAIVLIIVIFLASDHPGRIQRQEGPQPPMHFTPDTTRPDTAAMKPWQSVDPDFHPAHEQ